VFRDEQFADDVDDDVSGSSSGGGSDRRRLDEILSGYRLILTGKRVDPVDIRVKTGWWADTAAAPSSSAGKVCLYPHFLRQAAYVIPGVYLSVCWFGG